MEAVKTLTRNNASLKTQFCDVMKIKLDMSKKINLKATQNPEDKKLVEKFKKKAMFERNFYSKGYCWTYVYRVTKRHSIQTCSAPLADHQRQAIRKNIMEGSEVIK